MIAQFKKRLVRVLGEHYCSIVFMLGTPLTCTGGAANASDGNS